MKQLQFKSSSFELAEVDSDERIVKGYGSVFGNYDSDNDIIKRGAFKRTIKSWGPEGKNRIKLVSQHDINRPVAAITKMYEDEKGLYFEAKFGTHTDGEDHYRMVKDGILTEFSVGFVPLQAEKNDKGGINIEEIKLYEISLVTVAANDEALVTEVKSDEVIKNVVDKVATLDKDVAFEVEAQLLKFAKSFNIETTPLVEETQDPVVEKSEEPNEIETLAKAFNLL